MKRIAIIVALLLLTAQVASAAITAATLWEVRPTNGDNTFGACFDSTIANAGTDYSQQTTAQLSLTDLATTGVTTTLTSVTGGFTAAMIGNCIRINSGTNFTVGYYQITARTDTNTVTVDRAPTTGVGATGAGKVGGATKSISGQTTTTLSGSLVAGNKVYIKNEAWNEAVAATGANGTSANPITYEGYNTSRGDAPTGSNRPRNNRAAAGTLAWNQPANYVYIKHLWMSNAGTSGFGGNGNFLVFENVRSSNNATDGFVYTNQAVFINCEADTNSSVGFNTTGNVTRIHGSYAHGNTGVGISLSGTNVAVTNSISAANTSHGISVAAGGAIALINNTIQGNTGASTDGINLTSPDAGMVMFNNIISNNGRYGVNSSAARTLPGNDYNDYFGNSTAATNNFTGGAHDLTSNPTFTNSGSGDFSIGTPLRNACFPGTFPASTSTGRMDCGAVPSGAGSITQGACHRTVQ